MTMKKALAVLMAVSCLGVFGACGKETGTDSKEESSAADTTTTTAETTTSAAETTTTAATEATKPPKPEFNEPIDAKAITFDTPSLYACHMMGSDDGEANCDIQIVDYNGDKKMYVRVLDKNEKEEYLIPKLCWDLYQLVGLDNIDKIGKVTMDITFEAMSDTTFNDGTTGRVLQWQGGTIAGNLAPEKLKDEEGNLTQNTWAQSDWEINDWDWDSRTIRVETEIPFKKLPINGFTNNESSQLVFMRWSTKVDCAMYFDNITFYDKDGNAMDIIYDAEANAVEVGTVPAE